MTKKILILTLIVFSTTIHAQILKDLKKKVEQSLNSQSGSQLSETEIANGLKEALNQGVDKGVHKLSQAGGYLNDPKVKISMPNEAKTVEDKLRKLGQGKLVDQTIESMNRAAENAANGAKDIFVAAIKNMSIQDAKKILEGDDDAATQYLNSNTRAQLIAKFKPVIKKSLNKVNATKYWKNLFANYNRIPMVKKVNPSLEEYVTNKAIDGLFVMIAAEELEIRKNPEARITELLKKVFN